VRLYRVRPLTDEHLSLWAGSQAEASQKRNALVERLGVTRSKTEAVEVDVPTDKQGLIAFLEGLTG